MLPFHRRNPGVATKISFPLALFLATTFAAITFVQAQPNRAKMNRAHMNCANRVAPRPNRAPPRMQPTDSVLLPGIYWDNDRAPLKIGDLAPDFTLPLARDNRWKAPKTSPRSVIEYSNERQMPQISLGERVKFCKNGVTVVVFWAFWCDTWKDVSGYFGRMKPKLQAEKIEPICVAVDASQQPVARRAFANGHIWYPVTIDANSRTTAAYGVRRVPTLFVLDSSRRVREVFEGFPGERPLLRAIHDARQPFHSTSK